MPLITQAVSNLIQGVSQQSEKQRIDGQCREQENGISSVVDGLSKRPPFKLISKLSTNDATSSIADLAELDEDNTFIHFIERDDGEKYVVIYDITTQKLHAYNLLTGKECLIDGAIGGKDVSADSYFTGSIADSFKGLTVGDSTFLLNTRKNIGQGTSTSSALEKQAGVFIKQGDYERRYTVDLVINVGGPATSEADISVTLERYSHYDNNSSDNRFRYIEYRWRVAGNPTVNSGGEGYDPSLTTPEVIVKASPWTGRGSYSDSTLTTYTSPHLTQTEIDTLSNITDPWEAIYNRVSTSTGRTSSGTVITNTNTPSIYTQPTFNLTIDSNGVITDVITTNAGSIEGLGERANTARTNLGRVGEYPPPVAFRVTGFAVGSAETISTTFTSGTQSGAVNNSGTAIISEGLETAFNAKSGIAASSASASDRSKFGTDRDGNFITLTRATDGTDFGVETKDDLGGNGVGAIYKEVGAITDLPIYCKNGFRVKVGGNAESNFDDYYVKFKTNSGSDFGDGYWEEDIGYNIVLGYNPNTLPKELKLVDVNKFELSTMNFADRVVGDDVSNPLASFVGNPISNMFFYKNRLGFLSKDNIIFSESGFGLTQDDGSVSFNFNRTSVQQLLDSDPIDVTVSSPKFTELYSALGFQESLVLFSSSGQFALKGGNLLTPSTVSVAPITNFETYSTVDPLALGSYIYFPFNRGNHTGIEQFILTTNTDNYSSAEITEHVPTFIPKDIRALKGNTSENIIVVQDNTTLTDFYVYKYFYQDNKKLLSSWSKFTTPFKVLNFEILDGILYAVAVKESKNLLVELDLTDSLVDENASSTVLDYNTKLDTRIKKLHGAATTFTVTVGASLLSSSQNKYFIDGVESPKLTLNAGVAYTFDVSDGSNTGHDFKIGSAAESGAYSSGTNGVVINGTDGSTDATVVYTPPNDTDVYYFCDTHTGHGNIINNIGANIIDLGYTASSGDTIEVYDDEGNKLTLSESMPLSGTATQVTLASSHSGVIFIGNPYTMKYTFTNPFIDLPAGNSKAPSGFVKNKIRNGALFFTESSGFDVKVTPNESISGSTEYTNTVTDSVTLDTGVFKFPVFGDVGDTKITIESDSPFPSKFTSAEFEIFFHQRARRSG
tara:strand:- start:3472 stop:6840 length:3369 start_codon:yes stop_codon:yes gene_type:complete